MADIDINQISDDLLSELNLDSSELSTIRTMVTTAKDVVNRSTDVSTNDSLVIPAIKTLATTMYYDRTMSNGMPNGLLMMLAHLQANTSANQQSGDDNGS
ncbi:hypothetical protein LH991_14085 [Schleiferilactobacillus harbinensis]|uniref:hypothetical protein n=1 Tax=Schleiferilactobacillus harbinensis TaxID=304207 RepID=UPI00048489AB|nr:hypothetical protein [Schleiferilactobacillus harbinensis]QFR64993.1 hypothetical protein LH991_14085 [Schleiferilactobacillus harbinensis]